MAKALFFICFSALSLWLCYEILTREWSIFTVRDTVGDTISGWDNDTQTMIHDKKFGYFLQITDTHVSN